MALAGSPQWPQELWVVGKILVLGMIFIFLSGSWVQLDLLDTALVFVQLLHHSSYHVFLVIAVAYWQCVGMGPFLVSFLWTLTCILLVPLKLFLSVLKLENQISFWVSGSCVEVHCAFSTKDFLSSVGMEGQSRTKGIAYNVFRVCRTTLIYNSKKNNFKVLLTCIFIITREKE